MILLCQKFYYMYTKDFTETMTAQRKSRIYAGNIICIITNNYLDKYKSRHCCYLIFL